MTYTIESKAQWVRDDTGDSVSCTSDGHAADYFHISSTVTSNVVGTTIAPAKIDSITAPNVAYGSTHGTLSVKITDPSDAGVQGVTVNIAGGTSAAKQTNAAGCAVFEQVAAAVAGTDYTITLNTTGYVDHFGVQNVTRTTKVSPGKLQLLDDPVRPGPRPGHDGDGLDIRARCDSGLARHAGRLGFLPGLRGQQRRLRRDAQLAGHRSGGRATDGDRRLVVPVQRRVHLLHGQLPLQRPDRPELLQEPQHGRAEHRAVDRSAAAGHRRHGEGHPAAAQRPDRQEQERHQRDARR